jgi:dTDP-4-dehydrorhamnose 3,5-epimerase
MGIISFRIEPGAKIMVKEEQSVSEARFMEFIQTDIPEIIRIMPKQFGDSRGFFLETYRSDLFAQAGIPTNFVQDNHSGSQQGVLRGLHYQIRQAQGKLVRAVSGEIFDIAVDIRRSSPTFGKWVGIILSAGNKQQLWIPPGFAHGFYVLSEWAEVLYKATDYYAPDFERSLLWNDLALDIRWPLINNQPPSLSAKDTHGKTLADADLFD